MGRRQWHELRGIGWSSIGPGDDTGVLFFGGDAPVGAVEAVVRARGEEHRLPVTGGFFVFVAWNVAGDDQSEPALARFVSRDP